MAETSAVISLAAVRGRERVEEREGTPATGLATTRYLAAAAYTDRTFRNQAIEMVEADFRAAAPELAIDAGIVIRHCRIARRRKALRDAALCVVPVLIIATGIVADLIGYPTYVREIFTYYAVPLLGCWAIAAAIVFIETFLTQHVTLTRRFAASRFGQAPQAAVGAPASPQNVVVHGGFSPFVGSGFDLGGWSFAVNLEQGRRGFDENAPDPFALNDLYEALRRGFRRLDIEGLGVTDRLYVDGRSIRDDRRFLPHILSRPLMQVPPEIIALFRDHPGKTARHYLCLEIADWSGELILSTFVRLQKSDSKLFIETSNFLLPPLKKRYYELDKRISTQIVSKTFGWLVQSAIMGPILVLVAPFTTLANLWRPVGRLMARPQLRHEVKHNPLHNYGALKSIRELGTENAWRVYFQKLDEEMHSKVVQQQLLDCLIAFLDEHGIDTSEIKDRGTHILNNGVIVSGGSISAEGLAVGQGAQAKVSKQKRGGSKE
jgi:hypothetical protein